MFKFTPLVKATAKIRKTDSRALYHYVIFDGKRFLFTDCFMAAILHPSDCYIQVEDAEPCAIPIAVVIEAEKANGPVLRKDGLHTPTGVLNIRSYDPDARKILGPAQHLDTYPDIFSVMPDGISGDAAGLGVDSEKLYTLAKAFGTPEVRIQFTRHTPGGYPNHALRVSSTKYDLHPDSRVILIPLMLNK